MLFSLRFPDKTGAFLNMRIIDLTHPISKDAVERSLRSHAYLGTRLDAPALLTDHGKTVDLLPLNSFVRDAVLFDLTHKKPGGHIDDEDLEGAEERAGLAIPEGDAVILQTGRAGVSHNHPALSMNGAAYLEFKRVAMVGVDSPNLDHTNSGNLPAHRILLRREIPVLENLCNLDSLEQSRFRIIALPLKVDVPASPVRAVAIVDDSDLLGT